MNRILTAAFAAIALMGSMLSISSPAAARDRGENVVKYNSCYGDREKICTVRDPDARIRVLTISSRPKGSMANGTTILVIPEGPDGQPIRNEQGLPFITHAQTLSQANSQAMITGAFAQIPAAVLNGVGAAAVSQLLCKNCGKQQAPTAIAIANPVSIAASESNAGANANVQAALAGGGGTNPAPAHCTSACVPRGP